jgi:hypothetical protein
MNNSSSCENGRGPISRAASGSGHGGSDRDRTVSAAAALSKLIHAHFRFGRINVANTYSQRGCEEGDEDGTGEHGGLGGERRPMSSGILKARRTIPISPFTPLTTCISHINVLSGSATSATGVIQERKTRHFNTLTQNVEKMAQKGYESLKAAVLPFRHPRTHLGKRHTRFD